MLGWAFALLLASRLVEPADIEAFLRTADVVEHDDIEHGITRPLVVVLEKDGVTRKATWKTVDVHRPGVTRFRDGTFVKNFSDSYRYEVAAYELDKLLGTGLVPPTVERRWRAKSGSMQLWIEDATTDFERRQKKIPPEDVVRWNRQVHDLRLFRQLTGDQDYKNARNTLIDPEWKLWAIDSSRAFSTEAELYGSELERFSRDVVERLRELDFELLDRHLGRYLSKTRIEAVLARRDLLLARLEKLVAERGEAAVLHP